MRIWGRGARVGAFDKLRAGSRDSRQDASAIAVSRVLRSEPYGVRDYDPLTLAGGTIFLAVIATEASLLPTLRINRIDPAIPLRME